MKNENEKTNGKPAVILLGIKHFFSNKKQTDYYVLQLSSEFNDREKENGCTGCRVEERFVPQNLYGKVSSLTVGKPIEMSFSVVGSNAYLEDFRTVEG